jgi:hypothetical protein
MNNVEGYKTIINETFNSVSQSIGIHVLLIVVEHALCSTRYKYEEAGLIEFSEQGINLNGLEQLDDAKIILITQDFVLSMVSSLGRLVGKQIAHQLLQEFKLNSKEDIA